MLTFEAKDGFTLAIAAVGAVLGVINTWHNLNQRKVKLRVIPKYAQPVKGAWLSNRQPLGCVGSLEHEYGCIEVINLSAFAVSIAEIGFTTTGAVNGNRILIPNPITVDSKPFARRLEPHEAVSGYFGLGDLNPSVGKAYAMTDSGVKVYGTSPALAEMLKRMY